MSQADLVWRLRLIAHFEDGQPIDQLHAKSLLLLNAFGCGITIAFHFPGLGPSNQLKESDVREPRIAAGALAAKSMPLAALNDLYRDWS